MFGVRYFMGLAVSAGLIGGNAWADDEKKTDKKADEQKVEMVQLVSSAEAIGANVVDEANNTIGSIDDFVVLPDGILSYAIVGHGGVLGIGEDHVAVPMERVKTMVTVDGDGDRTVRFHIPGHTKDTLDKAPLLKQTGYPELFNKTWVTENAKYFGVDAPDVKKHENMMFAKEIVATDIFHPQGEKLAAIEYFVFNAEKPALKYIVVDHESGITDNDLVAIPVNAVYWTRNNDRDLVPQVDTTTASLNAAPRIKEGDFTRFNDQEFQASVSRVFPEKSTRSAN